MLVLSTTRWLLYFTGPRNESEYFLWLGALESSTVKFGNSVWRIFCTISALLKICFDIYSYTYQIYALYWSGYFLINYSCIADLRIQYLHICHFHCAAHLDMASTKNFSIERKRCIVTERWKSHCKECRGMQ